MAAQDPPVWYVVHARTGRELLTAGVLADTLQLACYLPEVFRLHQAERKLTPLFPGYLFIQPGPDGVEMGAVRRLPGVVRLVAFGGGPQPIPDSVIVHLRAAVEKINGQGGLLTHSFQVGDRVRLTTGPLAGLEAVFEGPMHPTQRVRVLLEFLGRLQRVDVAVDKLEVVPQHPPRRTRGHGRRIKGQ